MGKIGILFFLLFTVLSGYLSYIAYDILRDDPVPQIKDEYWGPSEKANLKEDESIRPFKIKVSQSVLTDLKNRLKLELTGGRLAEPLEGVGFQYGFNTKYLKEVGQYWMNKYNWTERENYLNRFPNFKTQIGGIDIHFQHVKPKSGNKKYKKTLPLLLVHGWPGSFVEYQKIIDFFIEPEDSEINFELIIPSLPGYGFSSPSARPGMSPLIMANILGRLMTRLGHEKFYALGEDWGSLISADLALLHPDRVIGNHIMCFSLHPRDMLKQMVMSFLYLKAILSPRAMERFHPYSKMVSFSLRESGYLHIQSTKPDTVGVGLSQSPSGLAAYILEKFSTWTNEDFITEGDGGLGKRFTMDELLDNVMVYWVTGSITSSMRLYSEFFSASNPNPTFRVPVTSPGACIMAPEDVLYSSELTIGGKFPGLREYTLASEGGHFTSYEVPNIVAKPAIKFFKQMERERSL